MYDGPIIDAHHHLWEIRNYPWIGETGKERLGGSDYSSIAHDYLVPDLLRDFAASNVVKSVHMEAHWGGTDPVDETIAIQAMASAHGFPHANIGAARLADPDIGTMLDRHRRASPGFRGIRDAQQHLPGNPALQSVPRPDTFLSAECRRGVAALAERDLICEMQIFANQFGHLAELAAAFPGMRFCLTHACLTIGDDDANFATWRDDIAVLARQPNVFAKASGTHTLLRHGQRPAQFICRQIDTLLDAFGAQRCFFASNFPVAKMRIGYDDLVAIVKAAVFHRPVADQRAFFHDTARSFYRL